MENVKTLSPGSMVLKRFLRSKLSITGVVILLALFLLCFLGPVFYPWGEAEVDYTPGEPSFLANYYEFKSDGETYHYYDVTVDVPGINKKAKPSAQHFMGTDDEGMDVFARLMYGGRISLTIGFVVVLLETLLGVLMGGLAGYFGKWVDQVIMRIVDVFNCIPSLPLLLIASAILTAWEIDPGIRIYFLMLILTVLGWAPIARMVRGQILSLREQEFMTAAESLGIPARRKIFNHLIPNVMPQLIVSMTLSLGGVILTESVMSYLGLGVPMPKASWGSMIQASQDPYILANHFNIWGPPGICILLAVLAFNFIGDGLRDAMDPKAKR